MGYAPNLNTLSKNPWLRALRPRHSLPGVLAGATLTAECQTLSCAPTAKETIDVARQAERINPNGSCRLPRAIPPTPSHTALPQTAGPLQTRVKKKPTQELCLDAAEKGERKHKQRQMRHIHHERNCRKKRGKTVVGPSRHQFQVTQCFFKET